MGDNLNPASERNGCNIQHKQLYLKHYESYYCRRKKLNFNVDYRNGGYDNKIVYLLGEYIFIIICQIQSSIARELRVLL